MYSDRFQRLSTGFLKESLEFTPGTMITALIIPDLISMGAIGIVSATITGALALLTRSMLVTVATGAVAAALIRAVFAGAP